MEKLFTKFASLLVADFAGAYKREKEFVYRFRSFEKNSDWAHLPRQLKVDADSPEEARDHLGTVLAEAPVNEECANYFDLRGGLESVDVERMRNLRKTVAGILIRKRILEKKRRKKRIEAQIQVKLTRASGRSKQTTWASCSDSNWK